SENNDLKEVFEEKLKRPMLAIGPNHAALLDHYLEFPFEVDAQMVIYGVASPGASVTLAGEPVKVDPDGNFSIRMEFPDKRQVLPVVACSRDGSQQRTTVLAIERNTKVMEAINMDSDDP
ncbi:MAG: Rho termination protein, partial [Pirellulaceae bacterium]